MHMTVQGPNNIKDSALRCIHVNTNIEDKKIWKPYFLSSKWTSDWNQMYPSSHNNNREMALSFAYGPQKIQQNSNFIQINHNLR